MPRRARAKPSEILAASKVEAQHFDLSELAHEMVAAAGGLKPFVRDYVAEMRAAKPGTIARYKLVSGILGIVMRAAEKSKPQTEAGNLSDEELHQALLCELKRRQIVVEEDPQVANPQAADPGPGAAHQPDADRPGGRTLLDVHAEVPGQGRDADPGEHGVPA